MVTSSRSVLIGQNLSRLRQARGLTQQDLADRCADLDPGEPINLRMIQRWETGQSDIPAPRLCTLASALEVTADRICSCLPAQAIEDASAITEAIARMSTEHKAAIDYIFRHWQGPLDTLMVVMLAYTSMPGRFRADPAFVLMANYHAASAAGVLDPLAPAADIDAVCSAWQRIATSHNIK